MSESKDLQTYTLSAGADLSAIQYHLMRQSAANTCLMSSLDTDQAAAGVLINKPTAAGQGATIADGGVSKVVGGASITQGKHFTCNGSGRAVTVTSGDMAYGKAITGCGGDGQYFTARLYVPIRWSGAP